MVLTCIPRTLAGAALLLAGGAAMAAEPVFPPGSSLGMVPPAGFDIAQGFSGYADAGRQLSIVVVELPAAAFDELKGGFPADRLKASGMTLSAPEPMACGLKTCLLSTGTQSLGGMSVAKWLVIARTESGTALVTANAPAAAAAGVDAEIRAGLATLSERRVSEADKVGELPFSFTPGPRLRTAATLMGNTALLTVDGQPVGKPGVYPGMIIAASLGAIPKQQQTAAAATAMVDTIAGLSDVAVTGSREARDGDSQVVTTEATAKDRDSGAALRVTQWVRYDDQGYIRIIALAEAATQATFDAELKAIAASVRRK